MKTVFFDVDTQLDFLYPAGALPVPGAENIVAALADLTRYAAGNKIQIVSTLDAHTENDPEFRTWKPHCVVGTAGQQKCSPTLLGSASPQIFIEKQMLDCFTNPALAPLLKQLAAERYVVYGVVSELCVQCAAFGLLDTGARVELVTDAIKSLDPALERDMLERFSARGGHLTTVAAVIA